MFRLNSLLAAAALVTLAACAPAQPASYSAESVAVAEPFSRPAPQGGNGAGSVGGFGPRGVTPVSLASVHSCSWLEITVIFSLDKGTQLATCPRPIMPCRYSAALLSSTHSRNNGKYSGMISLLMWTTASRKRRRHPSPWPGE